MRRHLRDIQEVKNSLKAADKLRIGQDLLSRYRENRPLYDEDVADIRKIIRFYKDTRMARQDIFDLSQILKIFEQRDKGIIAHEDHINPFTKNVMDPSPFQNPPNLAALSSTYHEQLRNVILSHCALNSYSSC